MATLDSGIFSTAEWTTYLAAAKEMYLRYMTTGQLTTGSTAGQAWTKNIASIDDLIRFMNSAGDALGLTDVTNIATPNFNRTQSLMDRSFSE